MILPGEVYPVFLSGMAGSEFEIYAGGMMSRMTTATTKPSNTPAKASAGECPMLSRRVSHSFGDFTGLNDLTHNQVDAGLQAGLPAHARRVVHHDDAQGKCQREKRAAPADVEADGGSNRRNQSGVRGGHAA